MIPLDENIRKKSPCIRNCCLDNNDICLGCFRSLIEITEWALVDEEKKQVFLQNALKRKELKKSASSSLYR